MERRRFRELLAGDAPGPERIFLTSLWFKGHNNPRYAELLPRLSRLDAYLTDFSDRRIPRGLQYRAFRWSRRVRNPALFALANRRYRSMLHARQRADPLLRRPGRRGRRRSRVRRRARRAALQRPNLKAYVVTAERAAKRYEELGVDKPWHVIPQGVSLSSLTDELRRAGGGTAREGEVVVGWMAAHLLTAEDRDGDNPLYNVDHLLELWDEIHARLPQGRLWLVGGASERVRDAGRRPRRHRPLRPAAARAGARDGGELRPRPLPAHQGPGDPGRQGR